MFTFSHESGLAPACSITTAVSSMEGPTLQADTNAEDPCLSTALGLAPSLNTIFMHSVCLSVGVRQWKTIAKSNKLILSVENVHEFDLCSTSRV